MTNTLRRLFDTSAIRQFTGLDEKMVDLLVTTFYEELTTSNRQLREKLQANDVSAVRQIVHTMRPGFLMFGIKDAAALMGDILGSGDVVETSMLFPKANRYLELATTLQDEIASYLQCKG